MNRPRRVFSRGAAADGSQGRKPLGRGRVIVLSPGGAAERHILVGLAPFADDSGRRSGGRHNRGGRGSVRRALYLAALSAARVAGPLKDFADRLRGRGNAAKVVLVAVARRLLVIANAVVREGRPWEPTLAAAR